MNRNIKKILSIVLSTVLFLGLIPMQGVNAAYTINGKSVSRTSVPWLGNYQCWEYANRIYNIIWGQRFDSSFERDNMLRNLSDADIEFTKENAKKYISQAPLGAVIRISNFDYLHAYSEWRGHNFIIVQKDDNGFTTLESISSSPDGRREKYWTYDGFAQSNSSLYGSDSWKYRYIKYIKWPGAPAYNGGHAHSWTETYEGAHPHYVYRYCSCGTSAYTGGKKLLSNCVQCYPIGCVSVTRSFSKTGRYVTVYRNDVKNANSFIVTLNRDGAFYATYDMPAKEKYIDNLPSGKYTATVTARNTNTGQSVTATCNSFEIANSYAVTYDANGGINAPAVQYKIQDVDMSITSSVPKKTGHVFVGWASSKTATEPQYQPGGIYNKNTKITMYAVWEPEIYTIKFDANGGKGIVDSTTIAYGNTMKMPNSVIKESYYLKGWSKTKNATTPDYKLGMEYMLTENMTLYAAWGNSTWSGAVSSGFAGGDGTEENPYQISNASELAYLAHIVNNQQSAPEYKYYILTDNINLGYEEWIPIGLYGNEFQYFHGSFDGNDYTISDLSITDINEGYVGLFGYAKDGEIKNLTISGDITGITVQTSVENQGIGAVVGFADGTLIDSCTASYVNISDIENIVTLDKFYIGGVCGRSNALIDKCTANESYIGVTEGVFVVGSIVGKGNEIFDCKVIATEELMGIYGDAAIYFGGICGEGMEIKKCAVEAGMILDTKNAWWYCFAGGISGKAIKSIAECTVKCSEKYENSIKVLNCNRVQIGGINGNWTGNLAINNCKYEGKSIIAECTNETAYTNEQIRAGGISGGSGSIQRCIANADGSIIGKANTGAVSTVGGIAGCVESVYDSIAIANTVSSNVVNTFASAGDIAFGQLHYYHSDTGKTYYDEIDYDNVYAYSGMEVSATNTYEPSNINIYNIAARRTLAQMKRASFLNQVFGPAYQSVAYLKENPEAVWVIRDGELPELYFNLLNDITVSDVESGTITIDKTQAVDGEIVTVTATPDENCVLNKIYVNGEEIIGTTFEVSGDSNVFATFTEKTEEYNVTLKKDENVEASIVNSDSTEPEISLMSASSSSFTASDGSEISVSATAKEDYTIDALYVNGEELTGNSFILSDNSTVTMSVASLDTDTTATTYEAENIGSYYADLGGRVDENSGVEGRYIRYWKTSQPDVIYTTDVEEGSGEYNATVWNLEVGTQYQFQMTEFGEIKTFTTLEFAPDGGMEGDNLNSPLTQTTYEKVGEKYKFSILFTGVEENNIFIAIYDKQGKMMVIKRASIANNGYTVELPYNKSAYYAKVFVWKKGYANKPAGAVEKIVMSQ